MKDTQSRLKDVTLENINWNDGTCLNFKIGNYVKGKKTTWSGDPASNAAYNMVGVSHLYVPGELDGNAQKQYTGFVMFRNADKTLSAVEYSPTTEQHIYMPSFRAN